MNVHLTFDIEVWCNGWENLDREFATCYPRYVYGRSRRGDYALPKTLEILSRHGIKGVFFVEPLFSARFGQEYLQRIVRMIDDAGQEIQLHLHPEWTDEIDPPILADVSRKRQHLTYYSFEEQVELIRYGKSLLEAALGKNISAFRSGSYAANTDTFRALARNDISCFGVPRRIRPNAAGPSGRLQFPGNASGTHLSPTIRLDRFCHRFTQLRNAQTGSCRAGPHCRAAV